MSHRLLATLMYAMRWCRGSASSRSRLGVYRGPTAWGNLVATGLDST